MTSRLFQDSKHALLYSKFRPTPPDEFIHNIIKYLKKMIQSPFKHAVDIGCGSGQSTVAFASHFEKVTGFDVSDAQIDAAKRDRSLPNINYIVADCYKMPVPNASAQLVTLSQSVHWFDLNKLFPEVKRILVPNGVIAAFGYWIPFPQAQDEKKTAFIREIISEKRKPCLFLLLKNQNLVQSSPYLSVTFFWKTIDDGDLRLKVIYKSKSTLADYLNYLCSWSAYQKLLKENNIKAEEIIKNLEIQLVNILDPEKTPEEIVFQLKTEFFLLMGHN